MDLLGRKVLHNAMSINRRVYSYWQEMKRHSNTQTSARSNCNRRRKLLPAANCTSKGGSRSVFVREGGQESGEGRAESSVWSWFMHNSRRYVPSMGSIYVVSYICKEIQIFE